MTDPDFYPINPDEELNPDNSPGQLFVNRKNRFLQVGEDEGLPEVGEVKANGPAVPLMPSQSFVIDQDSAGNTVTIGVTSGGTYTCVERFQGLLDKYGNPSVALSLRRLAKDYTGPLIRVRRDSDDDELDIAYNSSGFLDTDQLASFVPSGDGFVSIWYNQNGSGQHYYEGDDAGTPKPPRIVSGGQIISDGTTRVYPAIEFPGSRWLEGPNFADGKTMATFSIFSVDLIGGVQNSIYDNSIASPFGDSYGMVLNALGNLVAWNQDAARNVVSLSMSLNRQYQVAYLADGDVQNLLVDNVLKDTETGTPGSRNANTVTYIGKDLAGGFLNGKMQEIIAYNRIQDANAPYINGLQNDFFEVY